MNEEVRHFSLRKLSVGLASVLVGVSIFGASQTVKADTVADQTASIVTNNAKNNAALTQESDQKQDQAESIQQDSTSKTQETNDSKDLGAEKSVARAGSLQGIDNQSNTVTEKTAQHDTLGSGQKTQSFNLPKNSQKFNRRVLATNLSETTPSTMTNGGFDEATWGKLDVNNWQGSVQDGFYQLTKYTGDKSHIIVPNEADFEKAGKSTNGLQVGITRDTVHSLHLRRNDLEQTIAFSKTNNEKVKAIGTDWSWAFSSSALSKFDGSSLDVSNVTDMNSMFGGMFADNSISDLTSLANWNTSKVTDMSYMFNDNEISDLTPLANWDVSNVTNMRCMLAGNKISDLRPLANWNIGKVVNMSGMFADNKISDLTPLTNWKTSSVTNMSRMFGNSKRKFMPDGSFVFIDGNSISDLAPLTNWDVSNVTDMNDMFSYNKISNLTPLTNWNTGNATDMGDMFANNKISDLRPLANWNIGKVVNMGRMFADNKISDLTGLANWNVSNVTYMNDMFANNPDLIDLKPIANWNISDINDYYGRGFSGLFRGDTKLDLTNINNTPLMQSFLKKPIMLQGSTFIINNVDFVARLVKATTGKDVPILTNTATRTIVFKIPNATPETVTQTIYYKAVAPVQVNFPVPPVSQEIVFASLGMGTLVPYDPNNPNRGLGTLVPYDPNNPHHVTPHRDNPYSPKIIKTYPVKDPDWQLDDTHSKDNLANSITVNGQVYFKPVPIPHINGYKARIVRNPINHAMFMVSFMAVPSENKPSVPNEEKPSKPSAPVDNPSKPFAPVDNPNKPADDLQKHVAAKLNSNDLGWTMPTDVSNSIYTIEIPVDDAIIDLSDLVIAEPVHAQTRTQIHVNKHFKLSKKHVAKYLKHRKRVSKLFRKHYALL